MNESNKVTSIGVPGIDEIMGGGCLPRRVYMIRGGPGTGKTTLGRHFLTVPGERGLLVSLGERGDQLSSDAARQGFDFSAVRVLDLSPTEAALTETEYYDIMPPSDAEAPGLAEQVVQCFEAVQPSRVFIDSLTQMRYLAPDAFQFRRQVMSLLRYLTDRGATVMFTSEASPESPDDDLMFLSDAVLELGWNAQRDGRWFRARKYRGNAFSEGLHSLVLGAAGITVYPRLTPIERKPGISRSTFGTGIAEIDALLGGGLERGTVTMITGPTGVGKTTVGTQLISAAAARGERSVLYMFEESLETLAHRCRSIGIPAEDMIRAGELRVQEVEPLNYSPDEFAHAVKQEVEGRGCRIVMLDSLAGYRLSVGGEDVVRRLHALCRYLVGRGVTVLLINELASIAGGEFKATELGVSYLTDTFVLLRYLEMQGELRKCIGVLKKRTGDFEKTLREFRISPEGVRVGAPLRHMRGILRGEPEPVAEPSTVGSEP